MNHISHLRALLMALLYLSLLQTTLAAGHEPDSVTAAKNGIFLQRLHADVTSLLFVTSVALAVDVSVVQMPGYNLGIQAGLDFLDTPALMDKSEGTPFVDADFLGRFVLALDGNFSTEIVAGYSYRISLPDDVSYYPTHQFKYGAGLQWKLSGLVSLHARFRGVANASNFSLSQTGLGMSIGWEWD